MADLKRDDQTAFQAVLALQTRVKPDVVDEKIINEFIQLLEHESPMVRECAVVALGKIGDPGGIPPLIRALGDTYDDYEWRLAVQASNALEKIGEPAVPFLIEALDNPNENIRSRAAQTLKTIIDRRV